MSDILYGKIVIQTGATVSSPVDISITNLETGVKVVDSESVTTDVYSKKVPGLAVYEVEIEGIKYVTEVGFGEVKLPYKKYGHKLYYGAYYGFGNAADAVTKRTFNNSQISSLPTVYPGAVVAANASSYITVGPGVKVTGMIAGDSTVLIIDEITTQQTTYTRANGNYTALHLIIEFD